MHQAHIVFLLFLVSIPASKLYKLLGSQKKYKFRNKKNFISMIYFIAVWIKFTYPRYPVQGPNYALILFVITATPLNFTSKKRG